MKEILKITHEWANNYIHSFYNTDDVEVVQGIKLKELHTGYVTANCRQLAEFLGLNEHDVDLCELIGLLHDIGRFRQWSIYKTFRDNLSEDHADLGLKVIQELDFLDNLSAEDKSILLFSIGNHNKKEIAEPPTNKYLLFAQIIRDADKLDIYRVNIGKVCAPPNDEFSPICLENFLQGEQINFRYMKSHNDLRLVYLLWCYDVYFPWTLKRIIDRGYIEQILKVLPKNEQLCLGVARLNNYIDSVLRG